MTVSLQEASHPVPSDAPSAVSRTRARWGLYALGLAGASGAGLVLLFLLTAANLHPARPTIAVALPLLGGLSVGGMLALAFLPRWTARLRLLGCLAIPLGLLDAITVAGSAFHLPLTQVPLLRSLGDARQPADLLVAGTLVLLTCSAGLIVTRLLSHQASRRHFQPIGSVQALFLLFRGQHRLVGWMALALAAGHSLYFLLNPGDARQQWSGVAATLLMGALGLVGLVTRYDTRLRLWTHRLLAVGLLVALGVHVPLIPLLVGAAILGLLGATFVLLKLLRAVDA